MAEDHVAVIIGRAVTDSSFRDNLLSNPEEALQEYNLSPEEKEALKHIKQEDLEDFERKLDERIIKSKMW